MVHMLCEQIEQTLQALEALAPSEHAEKQDKIEELLDYIDSCCESDNLALPKKLTNELTIADLYLIPLIKEADEIGINF